MADSLKIRIEGDDSPLREQLAGLGEAVASELSAAAGAVSAFAPAMESIPAAFSKIAGEIAALNAGAVDAARQANSDLIKEAQEAGAQRVSAEQVTADALLSLLLQSIDAQQEIYEDYVTAAEAAEREAQEARAAVLAAEALGMIDKMKTLGSETTAGYIEGIRGRIDELASTVSQLMAQAVAAAKNKLDIHSPSKVFAEIGKNTVEGYILGLDEKTADLVRAVIAQNDELLGTEEKYQQEKRRIEQENAEKEYARKLSEARTARAREKIKQDYILKAQADGQKQYLDALKTAAEAERKTVEAQKKDILTVYNDLCKSAKKSLDELAKDREALEKKLQNHGDLYEDVKLTFAGMGIGGSDLAVTAVELQNLSRQTDELKAYADALHSVKERGDVPSEFFSLLRDMSVEDGTRFAQALLRLEDRAFSDYIEAWKEKQAAAAELSMQLYRSDAESLRAELTATFGAIPEDVFAIGSEAATSFGNGFMQQLRTMFEDMRVEIQSAFSGLMPAPMTAVSAGGAAAAVSNTYSATYNVQPAEGESTSAQLAAIKNAEILAQLRRE